jgi:hypothetical protein
MRAQHVKSFDMNIESIQMGAYLFELNMQAVLNVRDWPVRASDVQDSPILAYLTKNVLPGSAG